MTDNWVCKCKETRPSLTEEMIQNYDALPPSLYGWRRYRIEYGFECGCPEGTIYLPPDADPDIIEKELNKHRKPKTKHSLFLSKNYKYRFQNTWYINKITKKIFSKDFLDEHTLKELAAFIEEDVDELDSDWAFYFVNNLSKSGKEQVLEEIGAKK